MSTPQFNRYNKLTSPVQWVVRLHNQGWLEAPNQIKISFTVSGKKLTGSIAPDQDCFGPEFLLVQTLPDFELKIVLHLPAIKQREVPKLFLLFEQCFQEVRLNKWKSVISAHCSGKDSKMFKNLIECLQDYLKALA